VPEPNDGRIPDESDVLVRYRSDGPMMTGSCHSLQLPGGGPGLTRIRGAGFLFHRDVPSQARTFLERWRDGTAFTYPRARSEGGGHPRPGEGQAAHVRRTEATDMTDLTAIPWRTWGSGVICAATSPDETGDTIIGRSDEAVAARACADHNAMLDLAWLADAGYDVCLGRRKGPVAHVAHLPYVSLEHVDLDEPQEFYATTFGEALGKAREWAESEGTAPC
jgi:hypothetical protein